MKKFNTYIHLLFCFFLFGICNFVFSQPIKQIYNYTGVPQTYTVPCTDTITVKAWSGGGSGGGADSYGGAVGGAGAFVQSSFVVIPGQVLTIIIGGGAGPGGNHVSWVGGGAAGFGSGILDGGAGGAAGGSGSSGGGGGGGGGSGLYNGATPLIVAGGGGGGSGGGLHSSGATGGGGGVDGNPSPGSCNTPGLTGASPNAFGTVGANKGGGDGGGGGGGGGGLNGGTGGGVATGCDCGACGGGGGGNFSSGFNTTIVNGNGQTPGNSTDPDLPAGASVGGGTSTAGGNGFIEIYYNPIPLPTASFSTNPVCLNTPPTQFTDLSTGMTSWNWNFGDPASPNNTSTTQSPIHTYSASGTYTATLTVSNAVGCTSVITQTVTVNPVPVPAFSSPNVCLNNSSSFTNQTTGSFSGVWNFGEPSSGPSNISNLQNPNHTYSAPGTYTVSLLTTSQFGCVDSISHKLVVNPLPMASFNSTTVCIGSATAFTDLSTISAGNITSWSWTFGDPNSAANNTSTLQNPPHIFTHAGNFNVVLTATSDSGCQSTTTLNVLVNPLPVAAFTSTKVCLNNPTVFNNGSIGASQWDWAFGDGNISNIQNPIHTYLGSGTYVSTLIVTSIGSCKDTVTDTITVYPLPIVNFTADSICVGYATSFTDGSSISNGTITLWHWDFGDGNSSSLQNPTHIYSSSGTYNVTLTVTSGNGCVSSVLLKSLVYPLPRANFVTNPAPTASLTDNVAFNDLSTGNAVQWNWLFGDGDTAIVQNPSHVYSDTGTYIVTLEIVSNHGCVDTIQHPLEIKEFAFYIPNCFTPNGDGANDFFCGEGIGIKEYEMRVYDRWGNLIFSCKVNGPPQTQPCRWDGKVDGGASNTIVQDGVYVWKVHILDVFNKEYDYIGSVTVVR